MHRRQFIAAAAGAMLLPASVARANQSEPADATPAPVPQHHGRPRPIVLGDGIELIDYRIYPSEDVPRIIGEISSIRDEMVDSPVVSITFPDIGKDRLAYAPPVLPVMRPGESNMIFGVLPEGVSTDAHLEAAEFGLCATVSAGELSRLNAPHEWRINELQEERTEWGQHLKGNLFNGGAIVAQAPVIQGLVRDGSGRLVGTIPKTDWAAMQPGTSRTFSIWTTVNDRTPANPYQLLNGSITYSTRVVPAITGLRTQPRCPSLLGRY